MFSHNSSLLAPYNPTNAILNTSFPQGGIYTLRFTSTGINKGTALIQASGSHGFESKNISVQVVAAQRKINDINVTASPLTILCDGSSSTKITVQLLDDNGYPVFGNNQPITFTSNDTSLLVAHNGGATNQSKANGFGVASAVFKVKDCRTNNPKGGKVKITVTSNSVSKDVIVNIIKPRGYIPTGVNVYSDHTLEHRDNNHQNVQKIESHAAPSLISSNGEKPVYVTAQICEWTLEDPSKSEGAVISSEFDRDGDLLNDEFCNPVKKEGVNVSFSIVNGNIIKINASDNPNATYMGTNYMVLKTDKEGKATAVFRSTGTTPGTNQGCTNIEITATDTAPLDGPAYARVCSVANESSYPNAVFVWAQPAFITADGSSSTTLRAALYWCNNVLMNFFTSHTMEQKSSTNANNGFMPDDLTGIFGIDPNPNGYCVPVQKPGIKIKFESTDSRIVDDGMGGYKIITTTDKYGQANATFYSAGQDTPNIGTVSYTHLTLPTNA